MARKINPHSMNFGDLARERFESPPRLASSREPRNGDANAGRCLLPNQIVKLSNHRQLVERWTQVQLYVRPQTTSMAFLRAAITYSLLDATTVVSYWLCLVNSEGIVPTDT